MNFLKGCRRIRLPRSIPFAAALLVSSLGMPAQGQNLDWTGEPYFGNLSLTSGFSEDPRTVSVRAGQTGDPAGLGTDCSGTMGQRPDVRLTYSAGTSLPLNLYATSEESDLTLVVRRPDGSWICSDDHDGLDPAVLMSSPQSGQYNIWVGVYGTVGAGEGTLYISELTPEFEETSSADLNIGAEPLYATLTLSAAFSDDPRSVSLRAGGSVAVNSDIGTGCAGSVESAPHVRVDYTAGTTLPLNIYAISIEGDLTLVINGPDGTWTCNDDYNGQNPAVFFENPTSGQYDIFVGVYGGGNAAGTLYVSELTPDFTLKP